MHILPTMSNAANIGVASPGPFAHGSSAQIDISYRRVLLSTATVQLLLPQDAERPLLHCNFNRLITFHISSSLSQFCSQASQLSIYISAFIDPSSSYHVVTFFSRSSPQQSLPRSKNGSLISNLGTWQCWPGPGWSCLNQPWHV